jgi:hypothetical protein
MGASTRGVYDMEVSAAGSKKGDGSVGDGPFIREFRFEPVLKFSKPSNRRYIHATPIAFSERCATDDEASIAISLSSSYARDWTCWKRIQNQHCLAVLRRR